MCLYVERIISTGSCTFVLIVTVWVNAMLKGSHSSANKPQTNWHMINSTHNSTVSAYVRTVSNWCKERYVIYDLPIQVLSTYILYIYYTFYWRASVYKRVKYINRSKRLISSHWHTPVMSDYGGSTRPVDWWASSGVDVQSDAWFAVAVAALAGKTLVGCAFDDEDSCVSLQRFLWGWVPLLRLDDSSCFQATLLSASDSQLV